ncbi:MAG: hypothetical protein H0T62_11310 [Parachlamydiaceae bacterium]|nr:hypothetical protein [Parachlamydiaceae bacterium]
MKSFDELAEEVKSRELSAEEVTYIIQKVKELTITHDKDLPHWTYLLGFVKEYQGYEYVSSIEECLRMIEKIVGELSLLATYCPNLESIKFGGIPDDDVLACLDLFPNLLRFYINHCCCVTDQGLEHVWHLSKLTHLTLQTYRGVDDVFIENLCQLSHLIDLNLNGCDYVFNHNLEQIARLRHLRALNLGASAVTDAGISYIITMRNLVCLDLGGTRISDHGILVLSSLPELKKLLISSCKITDEALKYLSSYQNLEFVDLSNCENITEQGIKQLHPQIQVIRRNRKK